MEKTNVWASAIRMTLLGLLLIEQVRRVDPDLVLPLLLGAFCIAYAGPKIWSAHRRVRDARRAGRI
jgi:hypothetical protein